MSSPFGSHHRQQRFRNGLSQPRRRMLKAGIIAPMTLTVPTFGALARKHSTSVGGVPPPAPPACDTEVATASMSGIPDISSTTLGDWRLWRERARVAVDHQQHALPDFAVGEVEELSQRDPWSAIEASSRRLGKGLRDQGRCSWRRSWMPSVLPAHATRRRTGRAWVRPKGVRPKGEISTTGDIDGTPRSKVSGSILSAAIQSASSGHLHVFDEYLP